MSHKIIIDTNLWVYLYAHHPEEKYHRVRRLIQDQYDAIVLSPQIAGELYHVLTRKNLCSKKKAKEIIVHMVTAFQVVELEISCVIKTLEIAERYHFSYWDSQIVATALLKDCHEIHSEDMQHGQVIEKKVRIINPLLVS